MGSSPISLSKARSILSFSPIIRQLRLVLCDGAKLYKAFGTHHYLLVMCAEGICALLHEQGKELLR